VISKRGSKPMMRRVLISLLLTVFLLTVSIADAQQPKKIARIEYVSGVGDMSDPGPEAFRQVARREMIESGMMLRKTERIFEGALDLLQHRGGESSQPSDDTLFINRFDLFSYNFRCEGETSRAFRNHNVTGGEMGCIFRQRHDNNELAEVIDAIIGKDNGGPGLFDLDADSRVEINDYDITSPYAYHLIPRSQGWPKPRRRSASIRSACRVPLVLLDLSAGRSIAHIRAPFVCATRNQGKL
jgi:hypothetical protein